MATRKAAKKAPAKKAAKKAPAKKAPAKAAAPAKKIPTIKDKMTKTQILATLSESTGLTKKQVGDVIDGLETLIEG
ncbi:MAG: integration host factor, partial [Pseudomonadota bacterium]